MSQITIVRPWSYFGCMRALKINIDGKNLGKVGSRKTEGFVVSPGSHKVRVSMDWCKSKPFPVEVAENATVNLKIKTQPILFASVFCIFWPSKVFEIVNS